MTRKITISSVQPEYVAQAGRPAAELIRLNMDNTLALLHEAGRRGSDIALTPETFTHSGLDLHPALLMEVAETPDSAIHQEIAAICRQYRMHIVASLNVKKQGAVYNSCVFFDRQGQIVGSYDKIHCTDPELRYGVTPGQAFQVFTLDFGKVGAMICHDNSFTESAKCNALMGAEVIVWPHWQSGWGEIMWDAQMRSRAIDNGCILVSSSYSTKTEQGNWVPGMCVGRSGIVNDDGHILADAGREITVATAQVDLDLKRKAHCFCYLGVVDYKSTLEKFRKPEAYKIISGG